MKKISIPFIFKTKVTLAAILAPLLAFIVNQGIMHMYKPLPAMVWTEKAVYVVQPLFRYLGGDKEAYEHARRSEGIFSDIRQFSENSYSQIQEIAASVQEETQGSREILNTVQRLVDVSEHIKVITSEQRTLNESSQTRMETVIQDFSTIIEAIGTQRAKSENLRTSFQILRETLEANRRSVTGLRELLGAFSVR